jgi:hypothetical protein
MKSNVNIIGSCCSNNICTSKDLGEFSILKYMIDLTVSLISSSENKILSPEIGRRSGNSK